MSMMASAAPEDTPTPTVGVVAVSLPADSEPLRHVWIDERTLLIGYDPARLTFEIVELLVRAQYDAAITITSGVPA